MDIGFIGLGNMGQPMARRLIEAGHKLVIYDTRNDAVAPLLALGAQIAASPADVADRVETVMASLPEPSIVTKVATGAGGVIEGKRIKRFIDLSTTGSQVAAEIAAALAKKNIVQIDSPVSGGVCRRGKGHAGRDGVGPAGRYRRRQGCARRVRQGVRDRQPGRHGADHEARQQFPVRHGTVGDLRGGGDGRQGRARSGGDDRRHQCRLRPQHGLDRQVPQGDPAAQFRSRLRHRADAQGRAAVPAGGEGPRRAERGDERGRRQLGSRQRRESAATPISAPSFSRWSAAPASPSPPQGRSHERRHSRGLCHPLCRARAAALGELHLRRPARCHDRDRLLRLGHQGAARHLRLRHRLRREGRQGARPHASSIRSTRA